MIKNNSKLKNLYPKLVFFFLVGSAVSGIVTSATENTHPLFILGGALLGGLASSAVAFEITAQRKP